MSLNKIRSALYRTASLLGDVNAIAKGKVPQRIVRKVAWRGGLSLLHRLLKGFK